MAWRTGRDGAQIGTNIEEGRDGGLGEMGLGDKGERRKMRRKKEERREP